MSNDKENVLTIRPEAAWSRLKASGGKYLIFIDDGGIPIVGGEVGSREEERELLERMIERWYDDGDDGI